MSDTNKYTPDRIACEKMDKVIRYFGYTEEHTLYPEELVAVASVSIAKVAVHMAGGDFSSLHDSHAAAHIATIAVILSARSVGTDPDKSVLDAMAAMFLHDVSRRHAVMNLLEKRWMSSLPQDDLSIQHGIDAFIRRPSDRRMKRLVKAVSTSGMLAAAPSAA